MRKFINDWYLIGVFAIFLFMLSQAIGCTTPAKRITQAQHKEP